MIKAPACLGLRAEAGSHDASGDGRWSVLVFAGPESSQRSNRASSVGGYFTFACLWHLKHRSLLVAIQIESVRVVAIL